MNIRPSGWGGEPVAQPLLTDIEQAAIRIADHVVRTPLVPLHSYTARTSIFLKPETLQPIGSFKLRGVLNWAGSLVVLSPRSRAEHHQRGKYGTGARLCRPAFWRICPDTFARYHP